MAMGTAIMLWNHLTLKDFDEIFLIEAYDNIPIGNEIPSSSLDHQNKTQKLTFTLFRTVSSLKFPTKKALQNITKRKHMLLTSFSPPYFPCFVKTICQKFFWVSSTLLYQLHFQIERICNWHNKCIWEIEICLGKGRKHCWNKEKMLVTSIFSF